MSGNLLLTRKRNPQIPLNVQRNCCANSKMYAAASLNFTTTATIDVKTLGKIVKKT